MSKAEARKHCQDVWHSFLIGKSLAHLIANLKTFFENLEPETRLLVFIPMKGEVRYLHLTAGLDLCLYAPRTLKESLEFRRYDPEDSHYSKTEITYRGAPGPMVDAPLLELPLGKNDVLFMPCLGVRTDGRRLGRGEGYYDRWCHQFVPSFVKKAVAVPYKLSGLDFLTQPHDIKATHVITEKGIRTI